MFIICAMKIIPSVARRRAISGVVVPTSLLSYLSTDCQHGAMQLGIEHQDRVGDHGARRSISVSHYHLAEGKQGSDSSGSW